MVVIKKPPFEQSLDTQMATPPTEAVVEAPDVGSMYADMVTWGNYMVDHVIPWILGEDIGELHWTTKIHNGRIRCANYPHNQTLQELDHPVARSMAHARRLFKQLDGQPRSPEAEAVVLQIQSIVKQVVCSVRVTSV